MQLCMFSNSTAGCVGDLVTTDSNGRAVLALPSDTPFVVRGVKTPAYQDLFIFGVSGSADFRYVTYMGTREEAKVLARLIRHPYNTSLGYIVVGMDISVNPPDLEPAVGASAFISGISGGKPFIYNGIKPEDGQTVLPTGTSFVTWPDMTPGEIGQVSATPPAGQNCVVPNGQNEIQVQAYPDAVSVVSYLCQNKTEVWQHDAV
jgi:hypothetical protein